MLAPTILRLVSALEEEVLKAEKSMESQANSFMIKSTTPESESAIAISAAGLRYFLLIPFK